MYANYPLTIFTSAFGQLFSRMIMFQAAAALGTVIGLTMVAGFGFQLLPWWAWLLMIYNWVAMLFSSAGFFPAMLIIGLKLIYITHELSHRWLLVPLLLFAVHAWWLSRMVGF